MQPPLKGKTKEPAFCYGNGDGGVQVLLERGCRIAALLPEPRLVPKQANPERILREKS